MRTIERRGIHRLSQTLRPGIPVSCGALSGTHTQAAEKRLHQLSARNEEGKLVGVLLGLTDFAYWLFVTDLGVDRQYERQGIGRRLMQDALALAGGEKDIAVYLVANEKAVPFYEKLGMQKAVDVMQYNHVEWTPFTVQ